MSTPTATEIELASRIATMHALVVGVEALKAANAERLHRREHPAYNEAAFLEIVDALNALAESIRRMKT